MDAQLLGPQHSSLSTHRGLVSQEQVSPLSLRPFQKNWEGTEMSPSCQAPALVLAPRSCTYPVLGLPTDRQEATSRLSGAKQGLGGYPACVTFISPLPAFPCKQLTIPDPGQVALPLQGPSSPSQDNRGPASTVPLLYTQVQFKQYHCLFVDLCHILD